MTALKIKKAFCVLLCFAALTVAMLFVMCPEQVSAKTNAQIQSEIDALNAKLDNINDEQSSLKSMISTATADANNLSAEITNLNYEIDLIDEQVFVIESLIEQFNTLTAKQEVQIVNLEADIDKQQKMLDDMIRMSYEYGGVGNSVEFIFSAEDFSDLISRVDLLSYHLSYNNNVLDNYNTALEDLEKTKTEYEAAKLNMDEYKSQQETLRVQLEEKQAEAEIKRAQVYESKEAYEKELAEKQAYIDQLNAEIKALAAMFAKEDTTTYSGIFALPLPRNVYTITSYYGYRKDPFTGATAYHNGYDLACAKGTEIYAADDGTVVIAGWNGGYGNCVTINHGGGVMTLYGHCNSLNVVSGQQVKRGDVIAYVGTSGRSTGNHLHFTVYKNGNLTDPADYVTF